MRMRSADGVLVAQLPSRVQYSPAVRIGCGWTTTLQNSSSFAQVAVSDSSFAYRVTGGKPTATKRGAAAKAEQ